MKQTPIGWCSHHLGSVKKSFQFDNEQQMENFCLGLLAQTHKKISKVIAIEDHAKHNIEVEIISPTEGRSNDEPTETTGADLDRQGGPAPPGAAHPPRGRRAVLREARVEQGPLRQPPDPRR